MNLLSLSLPLFTTIFFAGCRVGTHSEANIPTEEFKVVEDNKIWSQNLQNTDFRREKSLDASKVVLVRDSGESHSGLKATILFRDEDKLLFCDAIKREKYNLNKLESRLYTEIGFDEVQSSERVIVLGGSFGENIIEIWLDRDSSISPSGEYIGDINLNNQLFGIYKKGSLTILDSSEAVSGIEVCWRDLLSALIEMDVIKDIDSIEDIYFGFKISKGREVFIINKFENRYR